MIYLGIPKDLIFFYCMERYNCFMLIPCHYMMILSLNSYYMMKLCHYMMILAIRCYYMMIHCYYMMILCHYMMILCHYMMILCHYMMILCHYMMIRCHYMMMGNLFRLRWRWHRTEPNFLFIKHLFHHIMTNYNRMWPRKTIIGILSPSIIT